MKRDFSPVVNNFDGQPIVRAKFKFNADGTPLLEDKQQAFSHHEKMTLRTYALDALSGRWRGEDTLTIDEIMKRTRLVDRLTFSTDGVIEIDSDEAKLIIDTLIKQGRDVLIIGRMKMMLDADPQPKEPT